MRGSISLITATLFLSACVSTNKIEPEFTTYPRDKVTKVHNVMNIPSPVDLTASVRLHGQDKEKLDEGIEFSPGSGIFQFQFTTTEYGDSAEQEIYILPRNISELNEESLLKRISRGGNNTCNGDYRVSRTKYFYGPEATLRFIGVKTPALRVIYRCPIKVDFNNRKDVQIVWRASKHFDDYRFFDISIIKFDRNEASTLAAIKNTMSELNSDIVKEKNTRGGSLLIASTPDSQSNYGTPKRFVIFVRGGEESSTVTMMYLTYTRSIHERGVAGAGTKRSGFTRGPTPKDRKYAYEDVKSIFGRIGEKLEKP